MDTHLIESFREISAVINSKDIRKEVSGYYTIGRYQIIRRR